MGGQRQSLPDYISGLSEPELYALVTRAQLSRESLWLLRDLCCVKWCKCPGSCNCEFVDPEHVVSMRIETAILWRCEPRKYRHRKRRYPASRGAKRIADLTIVFTGARA